MRALFPGRFQPFHRGHRGVVERIADEVDAVVIGVGSAQASHTGRNPFTAGERRTMIGRALADLGTPTTVVAFADTGRYAVWPARLQARMPGFDAVYSNNPLVARVCAEAGLEVRGIEPIDRDRLRGTEVRRRMVEAEPWRDLVPDPVAAVVDEIGGVERLRALVGGDADGVDEVA